MFLLIIIFLIAPIATIETISYLLPGKRCEVIKFSKKKSVGGYIVAFKYKDVIRERNVMQKYVYYTEESEAFLIRKSTLLNTRYYLYIPISHMPNGN